MAMNYKSMITITLLPEQMAISPCAGIGRPGVVKSGIAKLSLQLHDIVIAFGIAVLLSIEVEIVAIVTKISMSV